MNNYLTIPDFELRRMLNNPTLNSRGEYICTCVFCGKERHMYVNKHTQLFDCKRCGEHGSVYKILVQLGETFLLKGTTVKNKEKIDSLRQILVNHIEQDEVMPQLLNKVTMPAGWKVAENSTEYLLGRGITSADCHRYLIGTTVLFEKYKDYVLIPVFDNGEIRGFVGRYANKQVPKNKLRYNNSRGTRFSELLYGYDEIIDDTTVVILVEGIFDKISVDKALQLDTSREIKCVCTFGKKISNVQIKKLLMKGVKKVILLYDFDAVNETKKYGLQLQQYFETHIGFVSEKKDIDECSIEQIKQVFMNLKKPEDFGENIIGKIK